MKILIVVPKYEPNIDKSKEYYYLPLGLMYVSAFLKKMRFDVEVVNLNHCEDGKLREVLEKTRYGAVCTGGLFTQMLPIIDVIKTTRQIQPDAKVILGGALASGDPQFALENVCPDFLVLGEGEVTTVNLLSAIESDSDVGKVKGIGYLENGKLVRTEPQELISDLDSHPFPDYAGFEFGYYLDHYMDNDESLATIMDIKKRRVASIITSRNCIAKCTFCYRLMSGGHRIRSIENTMKEVKYLMDTYGINEIDLVDEMFANDKKRIYDFCKGIKPLGIKWRCQLRVGVIDPDVLATMKDAGCYYISYGFESASKVVLKSMKKGAHPAQFEDVIRWTPKAGITIQGNWIFGDPAETIETMNETLKFIKKFPAINLGMFLILPYPGTVLYHRLKEQGEFKDLFAFYINPSSVFHGRPLNMTGLSEGDFNFMCKKIWNEAVICHTFAKILKARKIQPNIAMLDYKCPNCSEIHRDVRIEFHSNSASRLCKKCFQKVSLQRSDVFFSLSNKLRIFYHHFIIRPMLINAKTYRFFEPLINFMHERRKIIKLVKQFLRGKDHGGSATDVDYGSSVMQPQMVKTS